MQLILYAYSVVAFRLWIYPWGCVLYIRFVQWRSDILYYGELYVDN